ncbi:testis-specific Y-encoded protein 3-like [Dasypus novemcinctus]|uniref:testis-specific Y-encoded protein 3-like n=1 Tax=Dasypus novemcinctus TaxID=9361 RepID=UPI0039C97E85
MLRLLDPVQILNHPQMSAIITDQDVDMLSYMINLEVEEFNHPRKSCKITFSFRSNPYFENEAIIKIYDITITGYWEFYSTPIQWFHTFEHQAYNRTHHCTDFKLVNLFSDHNFAESNRIAEIICEDLWLNPLQYYPRMEEARRGNREADRELWPLDLQTMEQQI